MRAGPPVAGSVAALGALGLVFVTGLCLGSPVVAPGDAWAALDDPQSLAYARVWEIRAPRTVAGIVAGAAFGVAGLLLQRALANPLAVPELLGVSSGAACAVAVFVVTGSGLPAAWYPALALVGALLGGGMTLVAAQGARSPVQTLLIGAAVSTALGAITVAVAAMAERLQLLALLRYLSGSVAEINWEDARLMLPWVMTTFVMAVAVSPVARILALGDDAADALGVDPLRARLLILVIAAGLVAMPTAFVGPIAWVGFAAPHLVRAVSRDLRPITEAVVTGLTGSVIVVGSDLIARSAFAPLETPLGAWTAAVAVLLAALLWVARATTRRTAVAPL